MRHSIARNHHYVPQAYLGLFTDTGDKHGQFHVLPTRAQVAFRTTPRNVAAERDFNRVDVDGYSQNHIESSLAPIEGKAVQVIRTSAESLALPSDRGYSYLLNLVCLLFVRNPARRAVINSERERGLRNQYRQLVRSRETWEQHLTNAREQEPELANVSFERAKTFIESEKYKINFIPEGSVRREFHAFDSVLQQFEARTWSLLVAPPSGSRFICSDNPVSLVPTMRASGKVALDTPHTEVFMPLTPNLALIGVLDERLPSTIRLQSEAVGIMNRRTARNAYRYMFSREETFAITNESGVHELRI